MWKYLSQTAPLLVIGCIFASSGRAELVGHWKFNGNLNDSVGSLNGVAINGATAGISNGKVGGAVSFNGVNQAVKIAGIQDLIDKKLSLSFWEYSNGTTNTGYFYGAGTDANGVNDIYLRREATSGSFPTAGPHQYNGGANSYAGPSQRIYFSDGAVDINVPRGQWNHTLVVFDATPTTPIASLHVNGVHRETDSTSNATIADLLTADLFLGDRLTGARAFDGLIDDLQIYDEVLGANHAAFLFNNPGDVASSFTLGDFDFLNGIDLNDYYILRDNLSAELDGPVTYTDGDIDGDGDVDLYDFVQFKSLYPGGAAGLSADLAAAQVPEPASVASALGAILLSWGSYRHRSSRR